MSKIDDKSGYDHILLTRESSQYFGIEWNGLWWVCTTLPFGWKNSSYVYQTIGLVASNFFTQKEIAFSLYIDDRLNGELFTKKGFWSRPIGQRDTGYSYKSAEAALYIVCKDLTHLGYLLGLKKCVLAPTQRILYLGMLIDCTLQAFLIPEEKKERFASLRESILIHKSSIPLKSLQRLMGKCVSFSLAFPGAKFYIREMAQVVGRASLKGEIQLTAGLREELELWRFLDEWDKHIPWNDEKHWVLSVSTDASLSRWAGVIHFQANDVVPGDFWESDLAELNINVKEMRAIAKVLESLPSDIRDCRVDVQVDNQAAIHTWMGRGGRSRELTKVARHIFQLVTQRNILLELSYVSSKSNPADSFSHSLSKSDSMLSKHCWETVEAEFGGLSGYNLDLMALDSNAQCDRQRSLLPHFTPYPTPRSAGVNVFNQDLTNCDGVTVNPYVFPPFSMIPSLISLLSSQKRWQPW